MLDADEGARRLGEFGIGCNPGIQNHMRNTLFDEKIEGTVHLAIGQGFPYLGGSNESAVHWDMVKELRARRPDRARRRTRPGEREVALLISADPRVEAYAKLLVERCLDVQPGMQVLIRTTPLARPAILALQREIARRGAYPILRVGFVMWPANPAWAAEAPEGLLGELSEIDRFAADHMDARITMDAPENSRDGSDLPAERFQLTKEAEHYFFRRTMASEIPWVSCAFPTEALAQDAGLTLASSRTCSTAPA